MLKFNMKEHKLEELEDYWFTKFIKFEKEYLVYVSCGYCFHIDEKTGIFTINNDLYLDNRELDTLYDLIKNGLLIKENNNEVK